MVHRATVCWAQAVTTFHVLKIIANNIDNQIDATITVY